MKKSNEYIKSFIEEEEFMDFSHVDNPENMPKKPINLKVKTLEDIKKEEIPTIKPKKK